MTLTETEWMSNEERERKSIDRRAFLVLLFLPSSSLHFLFYFPLFVSQTLKSPNRLARSEHSRRKRQILFLDCLFLDVLFIFFPVMVNLSFAQIWFDCGLVDHNSKRTLIIFSRFPFLAMPFVFMPFLLLHSWDIEIDRREWAHRGTWYSSILLLLRAHFSFCQLPSAGN